MPANQSVLALSKQATHEVLFAAQNLDNVKSFVSYSGETSFGKAASQLGISALELRRIVDVFVNLKRMQNRYGWSTSQLLDSIPSNIERHFSVTERSEALSLWTSAKEAFAKAFDQLSVRHPLMVAARAEQLAYIQEKLFTNVRIVTEIRPVFDETGNEILQSTVSHDLILDYYHGQNPERLQITMDAEDVIELRRACERAERKAGAIKTALQNLPWKTLVLAESEDLPTS